MLNENRSYIDKEIDTMRTDFKEANRTLEIDKVNFAKKLNINFQDLERQVPINKKESFVKRLIKKLF
jgi:hypothetical protein